MKYSVKVDAFEGPLDLLLHLITSYEIDIYDIPVAAITEQYMNYIHTMQELKLDVASEYLVMAATLLAIKSKMLLPKQDVQDLDQQMEIEMDEDPREDLVRRLIEYRKFKQAAVGLKEKETARSMIFTREAMDLTYYENQEEEVNPVANVTIYDMLAAMQKIFTKKLEKAPRKTTIERQEIPIETRMKQIINEIRYSSGRKKFSDLFTSSNREHLVVTFLAVLELMKTKDVTCEQENNFSEIFIYATKENEV
ncbi:MULTISPECIES: segregation/condensation protein A [unclassified Fictibacillus]|uniref:segregation/condensation protein A n=1 Tax=unclassified Fictibacillus TaxID=2644029 RepID=UPI0006A7B523|nr:MULTISPECIES: segregation/condensation protein A [unclassified Fictibacillus]MED2972696.1 segregation/condensation protein A [Fictibacillus sp. B-59209]UZJ80777.1 segregation/condensation protein A [Fictibacillus sp. KU28468]SFD72218.1 condensin subunit ScpA [Bacillus sp. OV194]